jgi:hypothetical protein
MVRIGHEPRFLGADSPAEPDGTPERGERRGDPTRPLGLGVLAKGRTAPPQGLSCAGPRRAIPAKIVSRGKSALAVELDNDEA